MDYLLRPVLAGMCRFESLKDGTLGLGDLALMNDALSVREVNQQRIAEWQRRQR